MQRTVGLLLLIAWASAAAATGQEWRLVGATVSDASRSESCLVVRADQPLQAGRLLMIETRDGAFRETYEVLHVYGANVILKEGLKREYTSGARLFQ